ncbi:MAG: glycogen debranching protein GlgX [Thiobacillus sp.]|uniref:glycogen debranching protein GlgX n=1 Tax=Thiobacillus sp. TaxID=924 RepID=UPI0028942BCC|nr:glycogen debranching protein GlgX [Thiobacillus sp.]MDT3706132.1 glycogen debranching protein GlgX [Thiobacillus sp.]
MKVWPGTPYPLGATYDGAGTNFSLFSEVAHRVELCLFDETARETRVDLPEVTGFCWHGYFPTITPGQRYGFRVHGPWAPRDGQRCNPAKLLLDPYAKAIEGVVRFDEAVFPYQRTEGPDIRNDADSAPFIPWCIVPQPFFDWAGDRQLRRPWHETVIYELHVKGFTQRHPDVPPELRGTYTGLAYPAAVEYLKRLGVTAVELMPVHAFVHDKHLLDQGLRNYWGYNSIGFFAPHGDYAAVRRADAVAAEFKQMVKTLHQAGIEVLLDVVYNHTAEGNEFGPVLCFKGIDNAYYYRLQEDDRSRYLDDTGTGNSINARHAHVLQLIMDSLRYWVLDMHVDGFRFDLAATLARDVHEVHRLSAFFDLIQQDPVISQVKLIAEPWDLGDGGYQVGNFPAGWSEWNGKYRDCLRDFWRGRDKTLAEFAYRFTGSSDLYADNSRNPFASINFVTVHDGFTLRDLVSYNDKHNLANGEDNRDGTDDNRAWNCGVEGPTNDPDILALRARQQRNFLVTLMLSQGVPMLLAGDEAGRTQNGNNNAYCQDNALSWLDWVNFDAGLLEFTRRLIAFRHAHPAFRRRRWFLGRAIHGTDCKDIAWFTLEGTQMSEERWGEGFAKSLGVFINGETIPNPNTHGDPVTDDSFFLIFNAHHEALDFTLPGKPWGRRWRLLLDTARGWIDDGPPLSGGTRLQAAPRSVVLLQCEA